VPSSYSALYYHLIWSTKHRHPLIASEWQERLYAYTGGVVRNLPGCKLLVAGGIEDHVHLLCSLSRDSNVQDVVRTIKTNTSKWIREALLPGFHWQDGYAAFTVSYTALASVEHYIRNQREHHRVKTFEEEMREIFKLCGIEVDERFFA
jgi:putative transposase